MNPGHRFNKSNSYFLAQSHANLKGKSKTPENEPEHDAGDGGEALDLGWKEPKDAKRRRKRESETMNVDEEGRRAAALEERREAAKVRIKLYSGSFFRRFTQKHRTRLLKELSARLTRDTQLRYAEQELTMQRALMGKGGSLKMRGVEKVGGEDDEDELNEDELDSMKIKKSQRVAAKKDQAYKPRVYRWRPERKK